MHRASYENETKNEASESSTRGIISIGEALETIHSTDQGEKSIRELVSLF